MNYKGKVVDTPVAPLTSTGKSTKDTTQCVYTEDTTTIDFFDEFKSEESDDVERNDKTY